MTSWVLFLVFIICASYCGMEMSLSFIRKEDYAAGGWAVLFTLCSLIAWAAKPELTTISCVEAIKNNLTGVCQL